MTYKMVPKFPENFNEEMAPTPEPEEPLAPNDGKWHAVQRRGAWFVERTYDSQRGPAYQQMGFLARGLFGPIPEDSIVTAFVDEATAGAIAAAFNGPGDE